MNTYYINVYAAHANGKLSFLTDDVNDTLEKAEESVLDDGDGMVGFNGHLYEYYHTLCQEDGVTSIKMLKESPYA